MLADGGDDTIVVLDRTGGNRINGGSEISHDTVDYGFLGESITLKAQGIVEKASGGVDRLLILSPLLALLAQALLTPLMVRVLALLL